MSPNRDDSQASRAQHAMGNLATSCESGDFRLFVFGGWGDPEEIWGRMAFSCPISVFGLQFFGANSKLNDFPRFLNDFRDFLNDVVLLKNSESI